MIRLTSRLTFIYRFVVPIVYVLALIIVITLSLFTPDTYAFSIMALVVTLFFLPFYLIFLRRLRNVYFDAYTIKIFDGRKLVAEMPLGENVSLDTFFFPTYQVTLTEGKFDRTYLILPKIEEVFLTFMVYEVASITTLKNMIRNRNRNS